MGVEGIRHPRGSEAVLCRYAGRREREREGEEHEREEAQGRGRKMHSGSWQFPDATFSLVPRPLHVLHCGKIYMMKLFHFQPCYLL